MSVPIAFRSDPPVRTDGICALPSCQKERDPGKSAKYGGLEAERDPFCSAECARAYHGVSIQREMPQKARGYVDA